MAAFLGAHGIEAPEAAEQPAAPAAQPAAMGGEAAFALDGAAAEAQCEDAFLEAFGG